MSLRRLLPLALVVAGLAVAAPAVAADPPTYCPDPGVYHLADGSTVFGNDSIAGCVLVRSSLSGALRLEQVIPAPGWTYVVKSDGGDHNRVQVQLTESTTRERVEFRIEPGKTVIK